MIFLVSIQKINKEEERVWHEIIYNKRPEIHLRNTY